MRVDSKRQCGYQGDIIYNLASCTISFELTSNVIIFNYKLEPLLLFDSSTNLFCSSTFEIRNDYVN